MSKVCITFENKIFTNAWIQAVHTTFCHAKHRSNFLAAINVFLDESIVMSPKDWERHLLLPLLKHEITSKKKERKKKEMEKGKFPYFDLFKIFTLFDLRSDPWIWDGS